MEKKFRLRQVTNAIYNQLGPDAKAPRMHPVNGRYGLDVYVDSVVRRAKRRVQATFEGAWQEPQVKQGRAYETGQIQCILRELDAMVDVGDQQSYNFEIAGITREVIQNAETQLFASIK